MSFSKFFRPIGTGGASALLAITTLSSYIVGLLRDKAIAYHFGTTAASDTYNASFLIPDTIFNTFIAGALIAAFMPVFSEYLHKDEQEANSIANTVLTVASIFVAFLAIIAFIFMNQLIPAIFPNIPLESQANIITMTKIMLPSALIFAISNTLGNVLMTHRKFTSFALSPVFYNIGIISGVILFNESLGIYSAAVGVLLGATMHLVLRMVDVIHMKYKYKFELKVRTRGFKQILKLMIPRSLSFITWQINVYIFAIVGMKMVEGGLAAFNYARNIQSFAVSFFGIAFATAVFPTLNSAAATNNQEEFTKQTQITMQRILFYTIPAAIGVFMLSEPITSLILKGGVFGNDSLKLTSMILTFYAFSIPLESMSHIFARAVYAKQDTIAPTVINIISMTVIAMITIFIAPKYGIQWFSIGFVVGYTIYNALFIIIVAKYLKGFDFKKFFSSFMKTAISTLIMATTIYLSLQVDLGLNKAILGIATGGVTFMAMAFLIKSPEASSITFIFRKLCPKRN